MKASILSFFKSFSFFSGILKTIAVLTSVGIGYSFNAPLAGVTAGLTIIMISPSDIPGNRKHHLGGIAIATLFVMISSVCINLTHHNYILLLPTMFILSFIYGYISLYGSRASMVSIAGIFSIALTFARLKEGWDIFYTAIHIALAGMGYIFLVQLYMWIKPRQYSEQLLGFCLLKTSEFFRIRAKLLQQNSPIEQIENEQKLLDLQTSLNESFEKLRDVLLDFQTKSGKTNYLQRQFLVFIELVDIFEWAIANPISHKQWEKLKNNPQIKQHYIHFLNEIADILWQLSQYIGKRKKTHHKDALQSILKDLKNAVHTSSDQTLTQWLNYHQKQAQKIESILLIFNDFYTEELGTRDSATYRQFVSLPNYSLKKLRLHFTMESPIFRHSLRLSIITLIGFCIGLYFSLENSYWILFTIYVIMRPGYATTKKRSKDRALGTLIGGAIAGTIIFTTQYLLHLPNYELIYGVIIILCMPFAYGLLQENFSVCVIFITIYIVLIYAIFSQNAINVLGYRIIDTMIGVVLSIGANYFLFPWWEYQQFHTLVIETLQANIDYLDSVTQRIKHPIQMSTQYKVVRKKAFLSLANLNAGFQRILQEPTSKSVQYKKYQEFILIEQNFVSSIAGLSLQFDTKNSSHQWEEGIEIIKSNLEQTIKSFYKSSYSTSLKTTTTYGEAIEHLIFLSEQIKQIWIQKNHLNK